MPIIKINPAAERPVSLASARLQCQIDTDITDEDDLLEGYIQAATDYCERYTGRPLITQEWIYIGGFSRMTSLKPNLLSVESIEYIDQDGQKQTLSPDDYYVNIYENVGEVQLLVSAPSVDAQHPQPVTINFTSGYGDADDVPTSIKQCILLLVAHWFRNRELSGAISKDIAETVASLLTQYRLVMI
jgi:uncharacterized phiE125 gp8 family phage protein